jgi:hypothetical protein
MKNCPPSRRAKNGESGYAIVIVMFFLALLVLGTVAAAPTVLSDIQREREADMVWKGEQYARGVKLYYMKTHRFPPSLEDLTTAKTGVRFMRQAYKDPMNKSDGSWRLIYVGPSGQLIGSLKNRNIGFAGQSTTPAAGALQPQSTGSSPFGNNSSPGTSNTPAGTGTTPGAAQGTADSNSATDSGQPQPLGGMMDSSNVIGGNIIGVGSKIDQKSFVWYDKAKNYKEFEFIWDPSKDLRVGGASRGIGTPVQNMNSNSPTSPVSPNQNLNDPNTNPPLQAPPPN